MKPISVYYRPEQSCDQADSFSPSAGKPAEVMRDWLSNKDIAPNIKVQSFSPVSRDILYAVHDPKYVDGVLDCQIANGFGSRSKAIADSLLYTVGSMVAAAQHVCTEDELFAVSPTSGFHHACYGGGGGFCTFNGLLAAAVHVHNAGIADRILILDFDAHYGNGTENIIDRLGIDYITHITAGTSYKTAVEALQQSKILQNHIICRPPGIYLKLA